jgi:hypothetical protein
MGTTVLNYEATIGHHVKSVDEHSMVQDVSCTNDRLTLHTKAGFEGEEFLGIEVGDVLVASSGFGCHTDKPSGRIHGRVMEKDGGGHGIIRRVEGVEDDGSGDVTVFTSPADHSDCFAKSTIDFQWTPPHHGEDPMEAVGKRHGIWEDSKRGVEERELLNLDALIDACKENSTINWTGDADINCNMDVLDVFDFYADMFSVNYDPVRKGAKERTIMALQDTVR